MIIIFDINMFISRKYGEDSQYFNSFKCGNKYYYIKPYSYTFLNRCKDVFDIGFWNFKTKKNCKKIMSMFLKNMEIKCKFIWYRNYTELVRDNNGILQSITRKNIQRVILSPSINKDHKYNENNVLLVDGILSKFDPSIIDSEYHKENLDTIFNLLIERI